MTIHDWNSIKYESLPLNKTIITKVRYHDKGTMSYIKQDGDSLKVIFEDKVFAITPGQSAVFYEGNDVLGGSIID